MGARDLSPDRTYSGCGLFNAFFGNHMFWLRRTTSVSSLPSPKAAANAIFRSPSISDSRRKQDVPADHPAAFQENSYIPPRAPNPRCVPENPSNRYSRKQMAAASKVSSEPTPERAPLANKDRKVPRNAIGISGELESMIAEHHKLRGGGNLVRASSSNVMLFGNLGNLRSPGTTANPIASANGKSNDHHDQKSSSPNNGSNYPNGMMGNAMKKSPATSNPKQPDGEVKLPASSFCRALSTRMDPETLKIMGNEDYKNGRFEEALALYDAAISIDPNKASYRSNKSAALTALGRILEAVFECREAIRIDSHYLRAHNRLATLYLRLGDADKALYHYKQAGSEADPEDISKAKTLQTFLIKCAEARKQRDLHTLIKESRRAISAGADSAPQLYALQAEAMLKLRKHEDADETLAKSPCFDIDECTKFFGPIGNANLLMVRAQVDLCAGRFEDALEAAQQAARLDPSNKEVNMVMKKARAVVAARLKGNERFRASRFAEACAAYGEGLEYEPHNSVLLCNRAACRVKLSQYEKAAEDCAVALSVRPSYSKARLRRADCYAKLEKWEASKRDYEVLVKELPEDEEVRQALSEVEDQLKRQHQEQ